MKIIDGPGFTTVAPDHWNDITAEVEADNPPFTLAADEGVGALQFSIALYQSGKVPRPSAKELFNMIVEFADSHQLLAIHDVVTQEKPLLLASATFVSGNDTFRIWQIFQAGSFALVTYTCATQDVGLEIQACESIVRSLKLDPSF